MLLMAACSDGAQGLPKGAEATPTPTVAADVVSTPTLPTSVPTAIVRGGEGRGVAPGTAVRATPQAYPSPGNIASPTVELPFGITLRREVLRTDHVKFYLAPDSLSESRLSGYAPHVEADLSEIAEKVGIDPSSAFPGELIITFVSPRSERVGPMELGPGQCPVRGVAITGRVSGPLQVWVVADDETPADQVIAVAAHEMAHHVGRARFGGIGDRLLGEGLATWLAQDSWLRWQGWDSLDEAVRGFRSTGTYIPFAQRDDSPGPVSDAECLAGRDTLYTEYASFVGFLIDTYGLERFEELADTIATVTITVSPGAPTPTPTRALRPPMPDYQAVYGRSLEELEQEWLLSLIPPTRAAPPASAEPTRGAGSAASQQAVLSAYGTWVLESLDGQPLIEDSFVMMSVNENWHEGYDGCNRFGGRPEDGTPIFDADGKFSPALGTRTERECEPEGVSHQAEAYFSTLMRMDRFRVTGDRLELLDSGGMARLVFVRQAPLPGDPIDLQGTGWRLLEQGEARAVTMSFLDYGLIVGVTACRPYLATYLETYRGTEGSVRFPSRSMLRRTQPCTEGDRRTEGKLPSIWAREYAVSEDGGSRLLRIRSLTGKTMTFEPLSPTVKDIAGTEWALLAFVEVRIHGRPQTSLVARGTDVTISLNEDGFSGSSGCNSYTGQATVEEGAVTIDVQALTQTDKVCEGSDALMEQEERFLELLPRLQRYGTYGDGLFLQTDNRVFLLFEAR